MYPETAADSGKGCSADIEIIAFASAPPLSIPPRYIPRYRRNSAGKNRTAARSPALPEEKKASAEDAMKTVTETAAGILSERMNAMAAKEDTAQRRTGTAETNCREMTAAAGIPKTAIRIQWESGTSLYFRSYTAADASTAAANTVWRACSMPL